MGLERIHLHPNDDDWNAVFVCDRCCGDTKLQNMFWDNETHAYVCSPCAAREQVQATNRRHTDGHA